MDARLYGLAVVLIAAAIFLGCIVSPPALMDDVDAVQAQIAANILTTGDWVTPQLDHVKYFEKPPLKYWLIAVCFKIFGVRDWVARIPTALAALLLCWLTWRMGRWAFGPLAGFHAGIALATCVGLFLFTRVLIADVMLSATIALAMWAFLRAIDDKEAHPRRWAALMAAAIGAGLLFKGMIGAVFPVFGALAYLAFTRQLWLARTWRRLRPLSGMLIALAIAAPWHVLATLRNPPYFDFTLHSGPGQYHGFFWFYFLNEQVLRFLNLRYPRDYDTVPPVYFWLFQLLWLFPWSVFLPALARLSYKPVDRAGRMRLLCLCWSGFLMLFFTFSSTQEYYSMPAYPALALLLGSAMAAGGAWIRGGYRFLLATTLAAACAIFGILFAVRGVAAPGDIARALDQNPGAYTLSLGHIGDLTLRSFAYLRLPLWMAGVAFVLGAGGLLFRRDAGVLVALMMVLFFHAARQALVVFDPYLSTRTLANALAAAPPGRLISDDPYWEMSSVFFYSGRDPLILNGRRNNLEYGSYAPGAPQVFIGDAKFVELWNAPQRCYVVTEGPKTGALEKLVGREALHLVRESGGKFLFTNLLLTNHADRN